MTMRFTQSCPTCGRRVQIRTGLIGCKVACQHCSAEFLAGCDSPLDEEANDGSDLIPLHDPLMERVELALKKASTQSPIV